MEQQQQSTGTGSMPTGIEFEPHMSVPQVAELWGFGVDKVREMFEHEPDVLREGHGESRFRRRYFSLRIPVSVVRRVHARLRAQ
jgi:hypothetical protein